MGNVDDALTSLSNNEFDLVLLDLNLGGREEGRIILSAIREKKKNNELPVLIVTAYDLEPESEKFYREKSNGIITKPFEKKTLLETVNKILSQN